jgi:hypothetical protein
MAAPSSGAVTVTRVTDLWTYTPPPPNTCLSPDPPGTFSSSPHVLGEVAGKLVVAATEARWSGCRITVSGAGSQLWTVDKDTLAVSQLTTVPCQANAGSPSPCDASHQGAGGFVGGIAANGAVYAHHLGWPAGGSTSRDDVWRVDGSGAGLVATGVPASVFEDGTALGSRVVWDGAVEDGWTPQHDGVWLADASGARKISGPGTEQRIAGVLGDEVYFLQDPAQGTDALLASNGSTRRTVTDLNGRSSASFVYSRRGVSAGGRLVFPAQVGSAAGVWSTDGSTSTLLRSDVDLPVELSTDGGLVAWKAGPSGDERVWAVRPDLARSASTTVLTGPSVLVRGRAATLRATVTGPSGVLPQGDVTFRDGATDRGTTGLSDGQATYAVPPNLPLGTHTFRASYAGAPGLLPSTSTPLTAVVKAASSTRLTLSRVRWPYARPARAGIVVSASPTTPRTGYVEVLRGTTRVVKRALPSDGSGRTSFQLPRLPRGTWKLRVRYLGNAKVVASTSAATSVTVTR